MAIYKNKIVLLVPEFPKLSETFIASKFQGLVQSGWNVHLVCDTSASKNWELFPRLNKKDLKVRVHKRWRQRPRWLAALLAPISILRCLLLSPKSTWRYILHGWPRFGLDTIRRAYLDSEFIRLQPDLVHFEFGALAVERMYLRNLLDCKLVVSFRGYDLNYVGLDKPDYYQPVWEKADALHLLGEDLWQRALQRGCPQDKAHSLIPPAIDIMTFIPGVEKQAYQLVGIQERPLRILSVGRLEWKKGYEFALQAIKLLQEKGCQCQYRILGGGSYLESLAFARHQLSLEEMVDFLGDQPHSEVQRQMDWADVFLHAAVSEGFGNAVLEAQAMQLPVVCSDADGLGENVKDGESGFVVPRRNPHALAEKLALLAADPALRQRMGQAGRARVQQNFQLERQISAFEKFYQTIFSKK